MHLPARKLSWLPILFVCAAGLASIASSTEPAPRSGSRQTVSIAEWARANGFDIHWLKREETFELSKPSWDLSFTVDSCEARLNGIDLWLSFPPIRRNGGVYLAPLDIETALRPLLSPARNRPGLRIRTICLDPGHGGKDPGYCVGSHQEKKYTLLFAKEVRRLLTREGFKVFLTRSSDRFVELPARAELAKLKGADLFVSLHFNASETSRDSVQGTQVFCITPAGAGSTNNKGEGGDQSWCSGNRQNDRSLLLAYDVQKALVQGLSLQDRGVRRARFAVLREASMPAILVEAGFMSHPVEGRRIFTAAYREKMAQAIAAGLLAYRHAVEQGA